MNPQVPAFLRSRLPRAGFTPGRLAMAWFLLAFLLISGIAHGDDTELFLRTTSGSTAARANILFLIDTSGSMDTLVATQAPWSPATNYTGCYRSDALYFSTNGSRPPCTSTDYVPKTANTCAASKTPLDRSGYYGDSILAWDSDARHWVSLSAAARGRPVECQSDRGKNGGDASGGTYAADGDAGPWASSATQEPAWGAPTTLYDGNWLNWNSNPPTVQKSRLDIVKETVDTLADTLQNVNIGVMRFNGSTGGSVLQPASNILTTRDEVKAAVNGLYASGPTPLSEALYEAGQYFAGRAVDFGNIGTIRSVASSRVGNQPNGDYYATPVTDPCQKNFIVLLTDGEPNQDVDANQKIVALPDFTKLVGPACDGTGDGACLDDMAEYLQKHDLAGSSPGVQNVTTHVIAFSLDVPLLAETARRGGGEYHTADDTASLTSALSGIVLSIFEGADSFAAPAVPVNAFNRTVNASDVYLSVFQPSDRAHWPGNVKKYLLSGGQLVGRDGQPVIDALTGLFRQTAFGFWSEAADGDRVTEGGAASHLPDWAARRLFTNVAGNDLGAAGNAVATTNASLTPAVLGVTAADRNWVIEWARGRDALDDDGDGDSSETRRAMGDPLHVSPVTATYGGTSTRPDALVFVTTNDGYLHAIDANTGVEQWAFIPARELPRLYSLARNEPVTSKSYGLDGQPRLYVVNDDGEPGFRGPGEQAILLFGMGRGGNGVYALDVTSKTAPRVLWEIDPRKAGQEAFGALGQTWSTPVVARVRIGTGDPELVAVFAGGYDPGQDTGSYRTDSVGNALYIVRLGDGALEWSAGLPGATPAHDLELADMQHSIPAGVRVLDLNADGLADRMYVGDMGGRIWRFDIVNGQARAGLVEGGVLASLGGAAAGSTPAAADLRRFYETPDVVALKSNGRVTLVVNIGSGYRGHPLDTTIQEAFFSVRDFNGLQVIPRDRYGAPVTTAALVDVTTDTAPRLPASAAGWELRMVEGAGEKVLGESVTIDSNLFFTSYTPGDPPSDCYSGTGTNRLYRVSLLDASPLTNRDGGTADVPPPPSARWSTAIGQAGLPPGPQVVFAEEGTVVCVGAKCLPAAPNDRPVRTYWYPQER